MKIVVMGPNPSMSYRNGGIARFMSYLEGLRSFDLIEIEFIYFDYNVSARGKLPKMLVKALGFIGSLWQLFFLRSKVNCVHLQASLYGRSSIKYLAIALVCWLKRYPLFIQIHGGRLAKLRYPWEKFGWYLTFRVASRIGVHPGPQYEEFVSHGHSRKLIGMANFVPDALQSVVTGKSGVPHFLFLGRVERNKGVFDLTEAYIKLRSEGIVAQLTIAGSGRELNRVTELVSNSQYKNDVLITGFITGERLKQLFERCNVFVLASTHDEGFPFSFLECSLNGMASLVTENSAIPYFFKSGVEYLPVNMSRADDLYLRMKVIATDEEMRRKIGHQAQQRVIEDFTASAYLPRLLEIYKGVGQDFQKS